MIVGYARVSTEEQHLDAQVMQLKAAGCDRIVQEKASGKTLDGREGLQAIMRLLGPGDVLVVCKLDRLARNTLEMLQLCAQITKLGAKLKSLAEAWADTDGPAGELVITIMAGVATFERQRMLERQRDGIARAQAEGKYRGRPPSVDEEKVREMHAAGVGATQISRALGIGRASVYRALAEGAEQT